MKQYKEIIVDQFRDVLNRLPEVHTALMATAKALHMPLRSFLDGMLWYDGRVGSFGNEVYADYGIRGALYLKYFIQGSYHVERQKVLRRFVQTCLTDGSRSFVDIGYGAPALYISDVIAKYGSTVALLDKFESAVVFTEELIKHLFRDTKQSVRCVVYDLDSQMSPGEFDVYVLFDSIEHAKDPTTSMKKIVESAPKDASFLFSIPIMKKDVLGGSKIDDVHYIEWLTVNDANTWISSVGLRIAEYELVSPNIQVDQWARGIDFKNYLVRCVKD